jgi:hypothetical protein
MSYSDWADILATSTGQAPAPEADRPAGLRGRLVDAMDRARATWNRTRFDLEWAVARARHRWLGLHTFVDSHLLDLDAGCVQYLGLRCLVCDAAPEL